MRDQTAWKQEPFDAMSDALTRASGLMRLVMRSLPAGEHDVPDLPPRVLAAGPILAELLATARDAADQVVDGLLQKAENVFRTEPIPAFAELARRMHALAAAGAMLVDALNDASERAAWPEVESWLNEAAWVVEVELDRVLGDVRGPLLDALNHAQPKVAANA